MNLKRVDYRKIVRGLHIKMEKHRPVAITNIKRRKQAAENTLWKQYGPKLCLLAIICAITAQLQGKLFCTSNNLERTMLDKL